ncbi:hypothetical protein [Flavobacterium sp. LC2016-23]|uniref:hypothetical protein n=1 Tax=Flavobacterium sp. LC2016-23 TaxID=2666330 RepID=UPI0018A20C54|nr:hypothetical protein [Flavobacterium sp. LC2016-23]
MKLESLKLEKFKDSTLKREQMVNLSGGGTVSSGKTTKGPHGLLKQNAIYDYGYDSYRNGILTFHNRSNVRFVQVVPGEKLPSLALKQEDLDPSLSSL